MVISDSGVQLKGAFYQPGLSIPANLLLPLLQKAFLDILILFLPWPLLPHMIFVSPFAINTDPWS